MGWVVGGGGGGLTPHALSGPFHTGQLLWSDVSKTGSNLSELGTKEHTDLSVVGPDDHHDEIHALNHITGGPDPIPEASAVQSGLLTPTSRKDIFFASSKKTLNLTSQITGSTDTFIISPQYEAGQIFIIRNGIIEFPFTVTELTSTSVQLAVTPSVGEQLFAFYQERNYSPGPYITDSSTLGLWHCDELDGTTIFDYSGNSADGTTSGTVALGSAGKFSTSIDYSGGGHVDATSFSVPADTFTLEASIKLAATGTDQAIVELGTNPEIGLRFITPNKIRFYVNGLSGGFFETVITPAIGTFKHYAGVYTEGSPSNIKIYEEGVKLFDMNFVGSFSGAGTHTMRFGKDVSGGNSFGGSIDEVRLSSVARNVNEFSF